MEPGPVDPPKKTNPAESSVAEQGNNGTKPALEKETSCSSSTSSSGSSDGDDFFQLDPAELNKPTMPGPSEPVHSPRIPTQTNFNAFEGGEISLSSKYASRNLGEDETQPHSGELGPRQSPPVQVMGRSDVPDPNRIPSSIFTRTKSTTPMEWSVASNESLFSIHVGNSSFSRDHVFLMGRSGELTNFSGGPTDSFPPPPISPVGNSGSPAGMDVGEGLGQPGAAEAANAEAMKDVLRAAADEHADDKDKPTTDGMNFSSISRQSDGSTTSFRSFAFPILTGEGRSGSIKVEPEQQRKQSGQLEQHTSQTETPKTAPATAERGWFACFSCCPFCH